MWRHTALYKKAREACAVTVGAVYDRPKIPNAAKRTDFPLYWEAVTGQELCVAGFIRFASRHPEFWAVIDRPYSDGARFACFFVQTAATS
jgi:hypothetical protein